MVVFMSRVIEGTTWPEQLARSDIRLRSALEERRSRYRPIKGFEAICASRDLRHSAATGPTRGRSHRFAGVDLVDTGMCASGRQAEFGEGRFQFDQMLLMFGGPGIASVVALAHEDAGMRKVHGPHGVPSHGEVYRIACQQLVPPLLTLDRAEYPSDLATERDEKARRCNLDFVL